MKIADILFKATEYLTASYIPWDRIAEGRTVYICWAVHIAANRLRGTPDSNTPGGGIPEATLPGFGYSPEGDAAVAFLKELGMPYLYGFPDLSYAEDPDRTYAQQCRYAFLWFAATVAEEESLEVPSEAVRG